MNLRRIVMMGCLVGCVLIVTNAKATPSADEIMKRNFLASKIHVARLESTMRLINEKGQIRERKSLSYLKLQPDGVNSMLSIRFSEPADIRGVGFVQIEHDDTDSDQWIYLPALRKSRRIAANNKKDSFVGSDFAYGDILLPRPNQFRNELVRHETLDGVDCYVIQSVPINQKILEETGYGKKITWVRADNYLETKVEYYDEAMRLLKTQMASDSRILEPESKRGLSFRREVTNNQTGHKTEIILNQVESGAALPPGVFSTRYLERE